MRCNSKRSGTSDADSVDRGLLRRYYLLAGLGREPRLSSRALAPFVSSCPNGSSERLSSWGFRLGTPVQWVGNHRYHHAHTDTPLDPHSPIAHAASGMHTSVGISDRTTYSVCILYCLAGPLRMLVDAWMRPRTNQEFNALAPDVRADPWYRRLSRPWPYAVAMHLHFVVPALLAWYLWGIRGFAVLWITLAALYNMGDAIDSVSHMFGSELPGQADRSRNSSVMGLLILGEGWHANHHRFPWSAKHGLAKGRV